MSSRARPARHAPRSGGLAGSCILAATVLVVAAPMSWILAKAIEMAAIPATTHFRDALRGNTAAMKVQDGYAWKTGPRQDGPLRTLQSGGSEPTVSTAVPAASLPHSVSAACPSPVTHTESTKAAEQTPLFRESLHHALVGESIRLELVDADIATMDHSASLCYATWPAGGRHSTEPADTGNETMLHLHRYARAKGDDASEWGFIGTDRPTCARSRFFMVDQRNELLGDSLIDFVLRHEQWGVELWTSLLTSNICAPFPSLISGYYCAANLESIRAGRRVVTMDLGSNHGFFGLFSSRLGFPTIAVDPQPHCAEFVRVAAAANGDTSMVRVVNAYLSEGGEMTQEDGSVVRSLQVPVRSGCWGTWPLQGKAEVEAYYHKIRGGNQNVTVPVLDPATLLGPNDLALLVKIDTEGAENAIMRALMPLLREGRVLNILMELNKLHMKDALYITLTTAIEAGFSVMCAQYGKAVTWQASPSIKTNAEVKAFLDDGWVSANVWIAKERV